ncbi:MAG TPA: hypothetical protein VFK94_02765, partial [Patescibacteria group bacterium]|nr:hypothetical protein [Patescibacteria group bacterium]
FVGTTVYVWNKVPDLPVKNEPVVLPDKPAVLSESTRQVELYLLPGPQPQIGSPISLVPPEVLEVQSTVGEILNSLISGSSADFSSLLSVDLTSAYDPAVIQSALTTASVNYGSISNYKTLGDPNVTGNFADQNVEVTTPTGTYRFQVFLKREAGDWKLMGTEPLP